MRSIGDICESCRNGCTFVGLCSLIGCLFCSWLAFAVLVLLTVDYVVMLYIDMLWRRETKAEVALRQALPPPPEAP